MVPDHSQVVGNTPQIKVSEQAFAGPSTANFDLRSGANSRYLSLTG
jgi:hypothetical protein